MELRLLRTAVAIAMVTATFVHTDAGSAVAESHDRPAYRVDELASLGGLASAGASINDRGWVAGSSDLPGDASAHATLWRDGTLTDLRTLGGPNSAVAWPVKNDRIVVGVSETATIGREGEDWSCSAFFPGEPTHHDCVGFVWRDGRMAALPTLGGPNGYAAGANRRGEVVGWAETGQRDPTCISPQVEQFLAVRWDASSYVPHELAPLPGDSTSAATAINDRGQVVGISGACGTAVGGVSATHAVMWDERGAPHDLGTIGGVAWNTPAAISDEGVVTGFANVPGGATPTRFYPHAFVWTARGGMRDLGTLPGDLLSQGLGVNDEGQIVGESCQAHLANCRAFVWQHGQMTDLNSVLAGPAGHLITANDINDEGRITGRAGVASGTVAFVASPIDDRSDDRSEGR